MVNFLLALPVAILGFTVASSLAAALGENAFWLLGAGLTASVIFPSLVASWLRALRKGNRIERSDGGGVSRPVLPSKSPTTSGTILVLNLCIILGSALLAPALTRTRLTQGGAWWVREAARLIAPVEADEITAKGEKVVGWFASMLPGGPAASSPNKLTLPGEVTGNGGVNTAPDLGPPRADGHEALMEGEELLISFQREGSAVVVPVWFSGPSGTAKVKMIFDTGATLTTLNRATLRSLGLVEDPSAPTVISHTANGTVRRRLTVVTARPWDLPGWHVGSRWPSVMPAPRARSWASWASTSPGTSRSQWTMRRGASAWCQNYLRRTIPTTLATSSSWTGPGACGAAPCWASTWWCVTWPPGRCATFG